MSYAVDVNVLLYASDRASDRHAAALGFLDGCAKSPEVFCLAWPTLMSYLRIATHPRIFAAPLSPSEALGNVTALLSLPQVRAVSELDGFVEACTCTCRAAARCAGTSFPTRTSRRCSSSTVSTRSTPTTETSVSSSRSMCATRSSNAPTRTR